MRLHIKKEVRSLSMCKGKEGTKAATVPVQKKEGERIRWNREGKRNLSHVYGGQ